jgi:D-alanine-D-alanine ligase-like ATP-grasp enzyme
MSEKNSSIPEQRAHYPYVTRSILRLMGKGALTNVASVDVEPDYGYVTRLSYTDGSHRITYGNDLGLNNAAACDLAKDKGHTKFLLRTMGVDCPAGSEFVLPWWGDIIEESQRTRENNNIRSAAQASEYIQEAMGYPVYVKPVAGSKGGDIFKVYDQIELDAVLELYNEKHVRVAMVEEPIMMPDYRVVSLDGELVSAYKRIPLTVTGDGKSSIRDLIEMLQQKYEDEGRDTRLNIADDRIQRHLAQQHMTIDHVLALDQSLSLVAISNLSAGGTSEDVTNTIDPRWSHLAAEVGENFNLRLVGLDLACEDITSPDAQYSVIEVNASPGLDHYALSGDKQKELVDQLYTKVLNAFPNANQGNFVR